MKATTPVAQGNVGLAFGLVIAAGACTCLGALLVCCTSLTNTKWLSGSLGASAGVMIYVSFVEILSAKAVQGFTDAGFAAGPAQRFACFAFFGGVLSTWLLSKLLDCMTAASRAYAAKQQAKRAQLATLSDLLPPAPGTTAASSSPAPSPPGAEQGAARAGPANRKDGDAVAGDTAGGVARDCAAVRDAPRTAAASAAAAAPSQAGGDSIVVVADVGGASAGDDGNRESSSDEPAPRRCCGGICARRSSSSSSNAGTPAAMEIERDPTLVAVMAADPHAADLTRMSLLTALAVGMHNLPEGIATFAAALASPATGAAIAVAIALHNIPEGVAVALPVYYATGSKWKGFLCSAISGAAEPLGGLIGFAVLSSTGMSPLAFGVLFGYVAGMMVYISLRELLPTALRFDPSDACVTAAAFWGMAVMAASLLLFKANEQ